MSKRVSISFLLLAALLMATPTSGLAGEMIGNTFVSEKFDPIELTTPGSTWTIKDYESHNMLTIAWLGRDDKQATIVVAGMLKQNDSESGRTTMNSMRKGMEEMGVAVSTIETARIGGKSILRSSGQGKVNGVQIDFVFYLTEGKKAYYTYQLMVLNGKAVDEAIASLDTLLETTKIF